MTNPLSELSDSELIKAYEAANEAGDEKREQECADEISRRNLDL